MRASNDEKMGLTMVFRIISFLLSDFYFPLILSEFFHPLLLSLIHSHCGPWFCTFIAAICTTVFAFSWLAAPHFASAKHMRLDMDLPKPLNGCSVWGSAGKACWSAAAMNLFRFRHLGIKNQTQPNLPSQFVLLSSFIQDTFHEVVSRQQSTYAAGEH